MCSECVDYVDMYGGMEEMPRGQSETRYIVSPPPLRRKKKEEKKVKESKSKEKLPRCS